MDDMEFVAGILVVVIAGGIFVWGLSMGINWRRDEIKTHKAIYIQDQEYRCNQVSSK